MDIRFEKLNRFIEIAVEEAKKGDHKQRVGCVIFDKKKILSKGHNSCSKSVRKLHPKFQRYPNSVHAEADAIIKAKKDLKGASILVIRINKKNQFRLSKPCEKCMTYINHVKIKKVFYTINAYPYFAEMDV